MRLNFKVIGVSFFAAFMIHFFPLMSREPDRIDSFSTKKETLLADSLRLLPGFTDAGYCTGDTVDINWRGIGEQDTVLIEYSTDGGETWLTITENATKLKYEWVVPDTPSKTCLVRVSIEKAPNESIDLKYPEGGELFEFNEEVEIRWNSINVENVKIEFSKDNGSTWAVIEDSILAEEGSYSWYAVNYPSTNCFVRIGDTQDTTVIDSNSAPFEIIISHSEFIEICDQNWATRNLNVKRYRNGEQITFAGTGEDWIRANDNKEGAWCYYRNKSSNEEIYGILYNWYAVNDPRGLAPEGWHVPTNDEWDELENCLGGSEIAGGLLKSTGNETDHDGLWVSDNEGATNAVGFSALPAGYRLDDGTFFSTGYCGFWTSTETNAEFAWNRSLRWDENRLYKWSEYEKGYGFSVRCIKD